VRALYSHYNVSKPTHYHLYRVYIRNTHFNLTSIFLDMYKKKIIKSALAYSFERRIDASAASSTAVLVNSTRT
jgi:hypothetical protein